jgi:RND family efflux transporter MFP subunit
MQQSPASAGLASGAQRARKAGLRPLLVFFLALACVVAAAIVLGIMPRLAHQKAMLAASEQVVAQRPVAIAARAHFAASKDGIDLPGDLQALIESPIFARANGYMKTRLVDYGDRVKAGQLMAEIETPELDQQISQARAALAQSEAALKELQADIELARANLNLAKVTLDRWEHLATKGAVSKQENDEKRADYDVKKAQADRAEASLATAQETVRASEANVKRLEEMKGFARVTAPFDGIVTERLPDVGTLINAGNDGNGKEMFRVAKLTPLRVFVNVPQAYIEQIHPGQSAHLRVEELPNQVFPAKVDRISNALDASSRAMLVILLTPNSAGTLYPGMYVQVHFAAENSKPLLRIPGDAVMLTKTGPRVATVDEGNTVHFRAVTLGNDFGSEVEILSGLREGELVISNPADSVQEGVAVDVRVR